MDKLPSKIIGSIRPKLGAIYWPVATMIVLYRLRFFKPKVSEVSAKQSNLFLDHYNTINEKIILKVLQQTFFTKKDTRAGWVGAGVPNTDVIEFKSLAKMAREHLMMYGSCVKFIKHSPNEQFKVLDVGCGIGFATVCMAEKWPMAKFDALDYDRKAIKFAKAANSSPNIHYYCRNFLNYKTENRYRYIFIIDVFEHIDSKLHNKFMRKALSLLDKDGLLFMITPNAVKEKDGDFSHVGLLNELRIKQFEQRYKSYFVEESFIDDGKLCKGDPNGLVVKDSLKNSRKYWLNGSLTYSYHIRLVMAKNPKQHIKPRKPTGR